MEIPQVTAAPAWLAKQKHCEQHSTRGALPGLHCKEESSWGTCRNQAGERRNGCAFPHAMLLQQSHPANITGLRQSSPLLTSHFLLPLLTCPSHLLPALRGGATSSHCCSSVQHGTFLLLCAVIPPSSASRSKGFPPWPDPSTRHWADAAAAVAAVSPGFLFYQDNTSLD